ncbi:MAG: hypothetical protein A2Y62_12175 [Candidatus Fischerbacteria bacterium RBG_13_37_8]|uniref:Radical SAM core domain-containing protein n=1 Tax=Candidatus Fischerbacteria bacterium RBG_13_37_8 TaxID=1817863 RepID=A0A1F5VDD2_9BACT|nr:MAG: hypothetical protein A2Y62_12175 [Candidatus Fischerbacteria bacterium RBG_13_37_8]
MKNLIDKIYSGGRLSIDDAVTLYQSCSLLELAQLANYRKMQLYDNQVFYIINQHINYSNICSIRCPLCAFSKAENDKLAYMLSPEAITQTACNDVKEFHIVGGVNNQLSLSYFTTLFHSLKEKCPDASIKALTPVEIDFLTHKENKSSKEILLALKNAGLNTMPGGGAEIFNPAVRNIICPDKISGERWLHIMKEAHLGGIPTNATMLYGHIETIDDRIEHMCRIRNLQDETNGFLAFVPLAFHPPHTRFNHLPGTTAFDDLKTIAIARLFLDNIPHIKAYWITLSPKLTQLSLFFGADDIDGTIKEEHIFHAAGSQTSRALTVQQISTLIQQAAKIPVQRDSLYNIV